MKTKPLYGLQHAGSRFSQLVFLLAMLVGLSTAKLSAQSGHYEQVWIPEHVEQVWIPAYTESIWLPSYYAWIAEHTEPVWVPGYVESVWVDGYEYSVWIDGYDNWVWIDGYDNWVWIDGYDNWVWIDGQDNWVWIDGYWDGYWVECVDWDGYVFDAYWVDVWVEGYWENQGESGHWENQGEPGHWENQGEPGHWENQGVAGHWETQSVPGHSEDRWVEGYWSTETIPGHYGDEVPGHYIDHEVPGHYEAQVIPGYFISVFVADPPDGNPTNPPNNPPDGGVASQFDALDTEHKGRIYDDGTIPEAVKRAYNILASTDPHRVVLPPGARGYEQVYTGALLARVMEGVPPELIHKAAYQIMTQGLAALAGAVTWNGSVFSGPSASPTGLKIVLGDDGLPSNSPGDPVRVGNYTLTDTVAGHLDERITANTEYSGQLVRPYLGSPSTIDDIVATGAGVPDPGGLPNALRFDVPGTFRGSPGTWELVIDPATGMIYHFNFTTGG